MFPTIAFFVGVLGHLSSGLPLESSSSDFSQFFSSRIVGGSEAAKGEATHMAALLMGWWFTCGASIITEFDLLTAAHCIPIDGNGDMFQTFKAVVGTNMWQKGTAVELKSKKLHPKYNATTIKNDIALLATRDKIQMNKRVATIALNFDYVGGGEKSFVAGWGTLHLWGPTPEKLQILYLETISSEECLKRLNELGDPFLPHLEPELEICTYHSIGHGFCHGDSGSALVSVISGKQSGIVVWAGRLCARAPDMHARVASYKDFILEHSTYTL